MNSGAQLKLPSFIAVGPGRTGTSWLHSALSDVTWLPDGIKETLFFKFRYRKGIEWYAWHFRDADDSRPIGEVCPYFGFPNAIERIATHIPECKIICTFRDPVERAYSSYRVRRRFSRIQPDFEKAIAADSTIAENNRYGFYLREWQMRFGKERVLATLYDDLENNPQAYLDQICDFIGARHVKLRDRQFDRRARNGVERAPKYPIAAWMFGRAWSALNSYRAYSMARNLRRSALWSFLIEGGEPYPPLSPETTARLRERFRPEVEALEELIGRDLSKWKDGDGAEAGGLRTRTARAS